MSKLIITEVGLLKTEKEGAKRSDGKVNRQFYTLKGYDTENPITGNWQRNVFQTHSADGKSAFWKHADYNRAKAQIGIPFVGEIVRMEVEPYDIDGRQATSFKAVVFKGENAASIAKANGHVLSTASALVFEKETP